MKKTLACLCLAATLLATGCTENTGAKETTGESVPVTEPVASTQPETDPETQFETENSGGDKPVNTTTFQNPLSETGAADPFVVYHDGYYYALRTEGWHIRLYRSKSIATVLDGESTVVYRSTIGQAQVGIWAPELHYIPSTGRWYIYACGMQTANDFWTMRMFCLESKTADPFGEYEFKCFTDPDLHAIDQTVFYDEKTDTLYTAYSQFTSNRGQVIMLATMENPWTISENRIRISHPKYNWEKRGEREDKDSRVNEGPIFLCHDGKLSLLYSASGCWSEYYCLGLVEFTGSDFSVEQVMNLDNWKKHSQSVFAAANDVYGVGHCSFFSSPDGSETWIAYHGMPTPDAGEEGRYMYVQPISFDEQGLPVLGEPRSRAEVIKVPSGEK